MLACVSRSRWSWLCLVAALSSTVVACADEETAPLNSAGTRSSSGGSAGSGGAGSGGSSGSSGSAGSAGSAGAAGGASGNGADSGATGGSADGGADAGAGGSSGSSGAAGQAGSSNDAGAADAASTFDASSPDAASDASIPNRDGGAGDSAASDSSIDAPLGDAGSLAYNPCPPKGTPCKIMPLGDSITEDVSTADKGGYRVPLLRKARAAMQTIDFVGSTQTGPTTLDGMPFPRHNEGHSGWTIDGSIGLYPNIVKWMTDAPPHIILLMIGTNDINGNVDVANAPTRLGKLIDRIVQTDPNVLLVVAQIIPSRDNAGLNTNIRAFNAAIPAQVQMRAATGKHVIMVDMYGAFTKNASWASTYFDQGSLGVLHPNVAGYVVMGDVWYQAIGSLLR